MPSKFLQAVAPFARIIPTIKRPERRLSFKERLIWSILVLIIYFLMASVPLYGIVTGQGVDPFWTLRVLLASSRGTLAELGIGPIVTGGLIIELLVGSKIILVDFSDPEERRIYNEAVRGMAVLMTLFHAAAYVIGGAYGSLRPGQAFIVFLQLVIAGIFIILLDEIVSKGYGIGSGISLFILGGVAQRIMFSLFSISPVGDGYAYGFIPALIQALQRGRLNDVIVRRGWPDLVGLITTIFIASMIIYLESLTIDIPAESTLFRYKFRYPLKFMYVSNIPVILVGALAAELMFLSQMIWNQFPGNFFASLFGTWIVEEGRPIATGGLCKYIMPPQGLIFSIEDPYHAVGYFIWMVLGCWVFGVLWVSVAGMNEYAIAEQLLSMRIKITGIRASKRHMAQYLRPYIWTATHLSSILMGIIAAVADILGAYATGSGLLLAISILRGLIDEVARSHIEELAPGLRRLITGRMRL